MSTDSILSDTAESQARELPRLIERMHRRYLDVVRLALVDNGAEEISPVQFMMLQTIAAADGDLSVRDLVTRGYYLGSNASYNLKQLVEAGYADRQTAARDKRTARVRLTERGTRLCAALRQHDTAVFAPLVTGGIEAEIAAAHRLLRAMERRWSEAVRDSGEIELP